MNLIIDLITRKMLWKTMFKFYTLFSEHYVNNYPILGKEQINCGISDNIHAQFEGKDLPRPPRLCDFRNFHNLIIGWEEKLP